MDGLILVDKPAGWTSHDVVARVRRTLSATAGHKIKVGHTGTLDPMATGLMILVVGNYTKRATQFSKLDKVYAAELTLGAVSSTADAEGEISQKNNHRPSESEIKEVVSQFVGQIKQVPPAYSAVKVNGQRAYKMARAGKDVKLDPREVQIYSIDDVKYSYPKLFFNAHVSSGTYIRSLAVDIGQALSTGAYLSNLRRIKIGDYGIDEARDLDKITLIDGDS